MVNVSNGQEIKIFFVILVFFCIFESPVYEQKIVNYPSYIKKTAFCNKRKIKNG